MWIEFFRFEIKLRLRQPLFWVTGLVLFLLAVGQVSTDFGVHLAGGNSAIARNAPLVLIHDLIILCGLGMLVLTAFVADSGLRDFRQGTYPAFFTLPVGPGAYLGGRFLGSMLATFLVFLLPVIGFAVGRYVPWQDAARVPDLNLGAAIYGWLIWVVPNLLSFGSLFFAAAILTRKPVVIFLFAVGLVMAQDALELLAKAMENPLIGSVLEPFGLVALEGTTRYWTAAEINGLQPPLSLGVVLNRLFWMGCGLLGWILAFRNFRAEPQRRQSKEKRTVIAATDVPHPEVAHVTARYGLAGKSQALFWQTKLEVSRVFRSVPFILFLLTGMVFIVLVATVAGRIMDTPSEPLTAIMVASIGVIGKISLPILVVIYSGELVWRPNKVAHIEDILPMPNGIFIFSKILALTLVIAAFIAAGVLATVVFQLSQGYPQIEPLLYLKGALIQGYPMVCLTVAAVLFHTVAGSKYSGHLLVLILLAAMYAGPVLGLENPLLIFAKQPAFEYSAFNGYGPFVEVLVLYGVYWALISLILVSVTALIWVRGVNVSPKQRLHAAKVRFRGGLRGWILVLAISTLVMGGLIQFRGGHQSHDLRQRQARAAEYELRYGKFLGVPLPTVTGVQLTVDLYPRERKANIKGHFEVTNRGGTAIGELPVTLGPGFGDDISLVDGGVRLKSFGGLKPEIADETLGFFLFELPEAMAPGEHRRFDFEVAVDQSTIRSHLANYQIVGNGSHFIDRDFLPAFGFETAKTLADPQLRKQFGLPVLARYPDADRPSARNANYLAADWVHFDATISTAKDQIALAPGQLQGEWVSGGRRFFHYRSEKAPMTHLFNVVSGKFAVVRAQHLGIELAIYYVPKHGKNIELMLNTAKATLDHATRAFGPYPHSQLKMVEVPRYNGQLAMSLAGMITISESFGFSSRKGRIDPLAYITAHEIAHQWWNHQVVPANAKGAWLISETLSEYTALEVLERIYGQEAILQWLRREEDTYLTLRKRENRQEQPLARVENQAYVHYSKGKLAFWALRDVMGAEALDEALRAFLEEFKFAGPPYPTAPQLLAGLEKVLPDAGKGLLEDWFETITLWDNRLLSAAVTLQEGNRCRVDLTLKRRKLRIGPQGEEVPISPDDRIEVGFYKKDATYPFTVKTLKVGDGSDSVHVFLDQMPVRVGLDPLLKTIDRDRKDNFKAIERKGRWEDAAY